MNFYELDPEQQKNASRERLFRYLRDYVGKYHPYLRRLYKEKGIDVRALRTAEDLESLPLVTKDDLQAHPALFVLQPRVPGAVPLPEGYDTEPLHRGAIAYALKALFNRPREHSLAVRRPSLREKIRRRGQQEWLPIHYHASSGSTGDPTPVMFTYFDLHKVVGEMASLVIEEKHTSRNYLPFDWSERWMAVMPGAPHVAFYSSVLVKVLAGVPFFETFGGAVIPTNRQIELFVKGGFSGLAGIPSYVTHWLRRALALQQENRIGPLSTLRRLVLGAEPVSAQLRDYIRNLALECGADPVLKVIQSYGMTEFKWMFHECCEGSGIHLSPKFYHWELLHPVTRKPVKPGEPGVLVFSHIGWRGTVLIRYWTGDLVKGGLRWDCCPECGYTFPRIFSPICRAERDFTKLKGSRVDLSLMIETVRDTPGVRRFQIALESETEHDEFSRDILAVHVVQEPGAARSEIEASVRARLKSMIEVSPDRIVFEDDEAGFERRLFAANGVKADYILERRKHLQPVRVSPGAVSQSADGVL